MDFTGSILTGNIVKMFGRGFGHKTTQIVTRMGRRGNRGRLLPCIDRINQRPGQIENQRFHSFPPYQIAYDFPSEFVIMPTNGRFEIIPPA